MIECNVCYLVVRDIVICGVILFVDLIIEIELVYCCEFE